MGEIIEGTGAPLSEDLNAETGRHRLSEPSPNGGTMEHWPVVGGGAAGVVVEADQSGEPTVWESFGGSLWGRDSAGRPVKLRGKWD